MGTGKEERLTRSAQFTAVFNHGKFWANELMVVRAMPNGLEFSRFGIIASKKVGNAVIRNRARRLIREAIRLIPVKPGWDIVIVARKGIVGTGYRDIEPAFVSIMNRARLLEKR